MLATIKWNSRYSTRDWMLLLVQLSALNALRHKAESKPKQPLWKHSTTRIIGTQPRRIGSPTISDFETCSVFPQRVSGTFKNPFADGRSSAAVLRTKLDLGM
jgi:hypothetical protein